MTRKEHIEKMLKESPEDSFLRYAMALEWMAEEDWTKAEDQLSALVESNADYLAAYYQLGQCREFLQLWDQAKLAYTMGTEIAQQQGNRKTLGELNEALLFLED